MQVLHDTKDKNHFVLTISLHIFNMIHEPKMNIMIQKISGIMVKILEHFQKKVDPRSQCISEIIF